MKAPGRVPPAAGRRLKEVSEVAFRGKDGMQSIEVREVNFERLADGRRPAYRDGRTPIVRVTANCRRKADRTSIFDAVAHLRENFADRLTH